MAPSARTLPFLRAGKNTASCPAPRASVTIDAPTRRAHQTTLRPTQTGCAPRSPAVCVGWSGPASASMPRCALSCRASVVRLIGASERARHRAGAEVAGLAIKPKGCAGLFAGAASGAARGPTSYSLINTFRVAPRRLHVHMGGAGRRAASRKHPRKLQTPTDSRRPQVGCSKRAGWSGATSRTRHCKLLARSDNVPAHSPPPNGPPGTLKHIPQNFDPTSPPRLPAPPARFLTRADSVIVQVSNRTHRAVPCAR